MKIAAKMSLTALATVLSITLAHDVLAQSPAGGSVPAAPAQTAVPMAAPAPAAIQPAIAPAPSDASVKEVLDSIKVPEPSSAASISSKKKEQVEEVDDSDKIDIPTLAPKVPSSVKGVVKKLNSATEDVTMDDLNSAREAIAKLDVLIDIEKRLSDLASIRMEREEKVGSAAEEVSSQALGAVPIPAPTPAMPVAASSMPAMPLMPMGMGGVEVTRVVGASGNYVAQVKDVDGSSKRIKAGDKLSDGSTVTSISRSGVTVKGTDNKTKTIQVKDVNTVFGSR